MAHVNHLQFTSREAIQTAQRLGWPVYQRNRSGEVEILAPDERRYLIKAPGRRGDDHISMRLRKLLSTALQAQEK